MIVSDLKKALLQQAFEGKLSSSDVNDTSIDKSILIINKQKDQLIEKYNVRNEPSFKEVSIDEQLFPIPSSWKWYRIGQLGVFKKGPFGSALTKSMFVKRSENTIKVYEQKNAIQKNIEIGDYYITNDYFNSKMKSFEIQTGDIIVSCAGTIGETFVIPENHEKGIINQALMKMTMVRELNTDYFLLYFDYILKRISNNLSSGSAIKNIPPFDIFKQLLIPLPPIEEQERIVNKINQLFSKLDEIEPLEEEIKRRKEQFPDDMRKSILKKCFDIECDYEELISLCDIYTGNSISESTKKAEYSNLDEGYNYIATKDVNFDHSINYDNGIKIPFSKNTFKYADINDILLCIEGGSAGKKIGILKEKVCFGNKLCKFSPINEKLNNKYLYYFLQSPQFLLNFNDNLSGIIGGVSINKIKKIKIPLPSIDEQKSIVAKIEQILPLCDDITELISEV